MNERIQELIKQATNPDYDGDDGPMNELNIEKFAELIVQECLDVSTRTNRYYTEQFMCAKDDSGRDRAYSAGAACLLVSTEIKEHFGVE